MSVKIPSRDVIVFDDSTVSEETIADVLFEDIGGIELLTLSHRNTVDGQNPNYTIISNLSKIKREFDASQIISRQKAKQSYFDKFAIDIDSKIPTDKYLEAKGLDNFYYLDEDGNLVIELDNMSEEENVEVQVAQAV